ncbi:hypothetical protein JMJ35_009697 [Cladonia borealis]|uniref:magnesium chelatase n=1 Tax=Cladonia borealis TaxID=184061 RepID=A0AA39UXN0_9LECA|nr:hypothetical protein JMJ35_009697 [Cladonia borealis]
METSPLVERVQDLTDLELAILLSLVAGEHCIIQTEGSALESLEQELRLVASNLFGLSHAVVHCDESTTGEDFSDGILVENENHRRINHDYVENGRNSEHDPSRRDRSKSSVEEEVGQDDQSIANIVIITGLPNANNDIQIQALELLRTRRMFTHTAVHSAPKAFLLIFLNDVDGTRLTHHLNDHIFISHYHDPEDGFANLEEGSEWIEDDRASLSSVVHRSVTQNALSPSQPTILTQEEIQTLKTRTQTTTISTEVKTYLHNIITFLRLHRAVAGGISPLATTHFNLLAKCLAPLHGLSFVTPSLIALAARKIYPHRITITSPENERSMQYGSDLEAVKAILEGVRPEDVIEDVLVQVEAPL